MSPFTAFLAAEHLQELLSEADANRQAKLLRPTNSIAPAWRRVLGRGVRGASVALGAAATRLDPERPARPAVQAFSRHAA
jgi:hypothetical protein